MATLFTDTNQGIWSDERLSLANKFHSSLRSENSKVGLIPVFPDRFGDTRWIHWEADDNMVSLHEFSLDSFVLDCSICFHLARRCSIINVFVDCQSNEEYTLLFIMSDGSIHQLTTRSSNPLTSILESLVKATEGGDRIVIGQVPSYESSSFSAFSPSELEGRSVVSATWVSAHTIALGLTKGDAMCVFVGSLAKNASNAPRRGPLLKDTSMLQSLLSPLFTSTVEKNVDTLSVNPISGNKGSNGLFVAINAEGYVRVWNYQSEQCISLTCLNDLIQLLNISEPTSRGFNSTERDTLRLQSAVIRGSVIGSGDAQYLVLCVGTLQIEESFNNKPHWQICTLVAKFTSPRDIGKFYMLMTPITSQTVLGSFHDLKDVQLYCDEKQRGGDISIFCVWRSTKLECVVSHTELVLDFTVLKGFVVNGQLREGLYVATSSVVDNEATLHRTKLRDADQLLLQHAMSERCNNEENALGAIVKRLEVVLLQRVFQTSRYSKYEIISALKTLVSRSNVTILHDLVEKLAAQDLLCACEHNESFVCIASKVILDVLKQITLLYILRNNEGRLVSVDNTTTTAANNNNNSFVNMFALVCSEFLELCEEECKALELGRTENLGCSAVAPASNKLIIAHKKGNVCIVTHSFHSNNKSNGTNAMNPLNSLLTQVESVVQDNQMYLLIDTSLQHIEQNDKQSMLKLLDEIVVIATNDKLPQITSLLDGLNGGSEFLKNLTHYCLECNSQIYSGIDDWSVFTNGKTINNMSDAIVNVLHIYLRRAKLIAILFTIILHHGRGGKLAEECCVLVRDILLPQVLTQLSYLTLVLWLNLVRPTNNFIAKHNVETANMMSLLFGTSVTATFTLDLYLDMSVLTNFVQHCVSQHSAESLLHNSVDSIQDGWINVAKQILQQLNPHYSSNFAMFLFQSGQYSVLLKWAQLLDELHVVSTTNASTATANTSTVTVVNDCRYPLTYRIEALPAFQAVNDLYSGSLRVVATLCESLRCLTTYYGASQLDAVVTEEFSTALNTELNSIQKWSSHFESQNSINFLFSQKPAENTYDNKLKLKVEVQECCQSIVKQVKTLTESSDCMARMKRFTEVLIRLVDKPLFFVFYTTLDIELSTLTTTTMSIDGFETSSTLLNMLFEHSYWIFNILSVYHLMNLTEGLERTQLIMSHRDGLLQIIECCLSLSANLEDLMTVLMSSCENTDVSLGNCAFAQHIHQYLYDTWAKIFEYSLLLGDACPQAFDAVLRLIDLEEDALFAPTLAVKSTWRQCLNALINHACDFGQLGWLCSLSDMQLGTRTQQYRLIDVIAKELEILTTDRVSGSYSIEKVFYFECLTTFLLCHSRFVDVVRIVDAVTNSLESLAVYQNCEELIWWQSVAIQALACLPASEQVVLKQAPRQFGRDITTATLSRTTTAASVNSLTLLNKKTLDSKFVARVATQQFLNNDNNKTSVTGSVNMARQLCSELNSQGLFNTSLTLAKQFKESLSTDSNDGNEMLDLILVQLANLCCTSTLHSNSVDVNDCNQSPFVGSPSDDRVFSKVPEGVTQCTALLMDCLSDLVITANNSSSETVQYSSSSSANHHHSLCLLLTALLTADASIGRSFMIEYQKYLSGLTDKNVIVARSNDVLALIRLCIRDKHFVIACNLTLILLTIGGCNATNSTVGATYYNSIDVLIYEAETYLTAGEANSNSRNGSSEESVKVLKLKLDELKQMLKQMFMQSVIAT